MYISIGKHEKIHNPVRVQVQYNIRSVVVVVFFSVMYLLVFNKKINKDQESSTRTVPRTVPVLSTSTRTCVLVVQVLVLSREYRYSK
jgi:uncharacterized membrane protein YbjE (DUF340 family)